MSFNCFDGSYAIEDATNKKSRKTFQLKDVLFRGKWLIVPENLDSPSSIRQDNTWEDLPPELLFDILRRVEANATSWPGRRDVVACASVCRLWRDTMNPFVKTPEQCGLLTFPISLKQPGPRDEPVQCFIRRDRATSMFRLYLGSSPALGKDATKLLLTAKKVRKPTRTEFLISLTPNTFSRASNTYVGKLRSNFLGTKFSIYDPKIKSEPKVTSKKTKMVTVSYELNVLRTKGPRRMKCTMNSIPSSSVQKDGTAPTPLTFQDFPVSNGKTDELLEPTEPFFDKKDSLVLKNKVPRWHEQLQGWCLNFNGRVTVASVKNFQLAVTGSENDGAKDDDEVALQFGKIGKDVFTMDYRYPLSAIQAFAICLSSFDSKPGCE